VSRPSAMPTQLTLPVTVAWEVSPSSAYAQRWRDRRQSFRGPGDTPLNPDGYHVTLIPYLQAKRWVETNHYTGTYPSVTLAYGLLYHGRLQGVATLGVPRRPRRASRGVPHAGTRRGAGAQQVRAGRRRPTQRGNCARRSCTFAHRSPPSQVCPKPWPLMRVLQQGCQPAAEQVLVSRV
jgi:hypothetical protein